MVFNESPSIFETTCDIDFNSNAHYEYLCIYMNTFMNTYLLSLISYLFNKYEIIKEINPINYNNFMQLLNNNKSGIIHYITCEILEKINVNIICLCASHINNINTLDKLENMLDTWDKQLYKTNLILSISYDNQLFTEVDNKIIYFKNKFCDKLIINKENICRTQFQHYKIICDIYYEQFKDYWVIFSDDDDIWSLKRTFIFAMMIQNIINSNLENNIFYAEYPFLCESAKYISSNLDIVNGMVNNDITMKCETGFLEYICYSLKFNNFKIFIEQSDPIILSHELCDRYFIKFLKLCSSINKTSMLLPLFGFSYYYFNSKYINNTFNNDTDLICNNKLIKGLFFNNKLINFNNDNDVNHFIDYIIINYYCVTSHDNNIIKHLNSALKQIKSTEHKNNIFIKCLDTFKNRKYYIFKHSPILLDGVINKINSFN